MDPRSRASARPARPRGAPVFATLALLGSLTQPLAPAFAASDAAPADSSGVPSNGAVTAPAAATNSTEDRHWAQLLRACAANAKHVRLHTRDRSYEPATLELEGDGIRLSARGQSSRSLSRGLWYPELETFLPWNEITRVEVRNTASTAEGVVAGGAVGLAIGIPIALLAAVGAAIGSLFALEKQDSNAGVILLAAAAGGALLGAAAGHHPNGGWVTCCERDSLGTVLPAAALP